MRSFFKTFFASFLALVVFCIVGTIFFVVIIAGIASSGDKVELEKNSVLLIDLSKPLKEQAVDDPIAKLTGNEDMNGPGVYDVVRLIHHAKTDDQIKGLYIKANSNPNGFATSQMIRDAIIDFNKSDKFSIAYADAMTQKAYYVASAAKNVYCHPQGGVEWTGLSANIMFLKNLLDKLEIQPQIFYAGKFKSATEPLRETKMTEPNRLQTKVFLNEMFDNVINAVANSRKIDKDALNLYADSALIFSPQMAVKYKLIDAVKIDNDVKSEILKNLGEKTTKEKIEFIEPANYDKAVTYKNTDSKNKIAVIYAEGEIIDGKKQNNYITSEEYKNLIRKARLDKKIKAIVLRVNSPGGSALASDVIWSEVMLAKKAKPVVVSMGDVAASGGYYISCGANKIFAEPTTLTGSIGVFGIIPNMQKFFNDKLGITFDGVKTHTYADMGEISRPLTAGEKRLIQAQIDTIYHVFKSRVASGRKLSPEAVDSIAQGRVWTGISAKKIGLVDELGGLDKAIQSAAKMAKLDDYAIREYPKKQNFLEKLFGGSASKGIKEKMISSEIGEDQMMIYKKIKSVNNLVNKPQARLPFDLIIE